MQFSNDKDGVLKLVAQTEAEHGFLRELRRAFFEGSVTIEARNHTPQHSCLECLSRKKYNDCVTASAIFNIEHNPVKM